MLTDVEILGDLIVNGDTTYISVETLTIEDNKVILNQADDSTVGDDVSADQGGIMLQSIHGSKDILWSQATDSWTFNRAIDILDTQGLAINGVQIITPNSISPVITSATGLSSIGTLNDLTVSGLTTLTGELRVNGDDLNVITGNASFGNNVTTDGVVKVGKQLELDATTDPTTVFQSAHVYSKLVAGLSEVFVKDEAGNVTQISPHNSDGDWVYYSENIKTGKKVKVNMEKMIRKLEEITGESFFEEFTPGND